MHYSGVFLCFGVNKLLENYRQIFCKKKIGILIYFTKISSRCHTVLIRPYLVPVHYNTLNGNKTAIIMYLLYRSHNPTPMNKLTFYFISYFETWTYTWCSFTIFTKFKCQSIGRRSRRVVRPDNKRSHDQNSNDILVCLIR